MLLVIADFPITKTENVRSMRGGGERRRKKDEEDSTIWSYDTISASKISKHKKLKSIRVSDRMGRQEQGQGR